MRADHPGGRFTIAYELDSIGRGIHSDLEHPVGQVVAWWRWDAETSEVDPVYDVGSLGVGRRWVAPFEMLVISAKVYQGVSMQNERGLYNTNVLRLTVNMKDIRDRLPELEYNPDRHLRDRVVYDRAVYSPNRVFPTGRVLDYPTVLVVDLAQVMPDQMVNDDQFLSFTDGLG